MTLRSDHIDTGLVEHLCLRYEVEVWENEGEVYYKLDKKTENAVERN